MPPDAPPPESSPALRAFLVSEAGGGVVLIVAATLALVAANLPATSAAYAVLLHHATGPVLAPALGPMTVHLWINDALMTLFFLLVGLEIKREWRVGALASRRDRVLPGLVAAAGMAAPALVYAMVVRDHPALLRGWAIPAATDIAFAVGVLALLGPRVPPALRLFLTAVAIVDDMGAVAIIALFHTQAIDLGALAGAAGVMAAMAAMNRRGVVRLTPYMVGFVLLWLLVLRSGVHATVAGVLAAMMVPMAGTERTSEHGPLHRLERTLAPWVGYAIVPLFAFANAGVSLAGLSLATLAQPLVVAIVLGLFLGKQAGVMAAVWLAARTGLAARPAGGWRRIWGVALLAGIGFTMSLFIGELAFPGDPRLADQVKLGVLGGSLLAAISGFLVLRFAPRAHSPDNPTDR